MAIAGGPELDTSPVPTVTTYIPEEFLMGINLESPSEMGAYRLVNRVWRDLQAAQGLDALLAGIGGV